MSNLLNFNDAIALLKTCVNESTIVGQKHMDLSVVDAKNVNEFHKAMMVVRSAVLRQEYTQAQINSLLGL